MKHEHLWSFLGELALVLSAKEMRQGDVSFRRAEYCTECGSIRVEFGNRWAYMESKVTLDFLGQFEGTKDTVLPTKPEEIYTSSVIATQKKRLGRGLADLMKQVEGQGAGLTLLLGGKKSNNQGETGDDKTTRPTGQSQAKRETKGEAKDSAHKEAEQSKCDTV